MEKSCYLSKQFNYLCRQIFLQIHIFIAILRHFFDPLDLALLCPLQLHQMNWNYHTFFVEIIPLKCEKRGTIECQVNCSSLQHIHFAVFDSAPNRSLAGYLPINNDKVSKLVINL